MQFKADSSIIKKLKFLLGFFGVFCFVIVVVRLYKLQIVDHEFYQQKAIAQQTTDREIPARRGTIYDRNMRPLAISADAEMVTIEPSKIANKEQGLIIAKELAAILEMDEQELVAHVQSGKAYVMLQGDVDSEKCDAVRAFVKEYNANEDAKVKEAKAKDETYKAEKINSVFVRPDTARRYPYGDFLSHVLGFVGRDEGLYGLEKYYESTLKGTPGRIVGSVNGKGDALPEEYEMRYDAIDGNSIVLTIDEVLQHYLEKNLEIAYNDNKVELKATGIIMDVNTGGILAMASYPDFDLNDPYTIADVELRESIEAMEDEAERKLARQNALNAQMRISPISDTYYAGSTFKIITSAIAIEEQAVTPKTTFYCSGKKYLEKWGDVSCWKTAGHGSLSLGDAIRHSCNPAFMDIGAAIGWDNMTKYHNAFGLGKKTGIDLPGESSGWWFPTSTATENAINLAVGSFGQNFPITPLQLITAVSAVANGGTLLKPHIVKEIVDSNGNVVESFGREEVRQVLSKETSEYMNEVLESVVTQGTGKNAYTMGYRIGGKTGTTEKIGLVVDGKNKRISSFIAYAPADNPQIAVLVLLDQPTVMPVTGGITVAPVVRRIMEEALPYLNIEAKYTDEEMQVKDLVVPDVSGLDKAGAETMLKNAGFSYRTEGTGDIVTGQLPAPGYTVANTTKIILYMGQEVPENTITMPELTGMTLENAKKALTNVGLFYHVTGLEIASSGQIVVTRQSVEQGTQVAFGTVVTIELADLDQKVT